MSMKIKSLFVATTLGLAGCGGPTFSDIANSHMTPEQGAAFIQGLSLLQGNINHQYDLQAQQNMNWYNTEMNGIIGAGMIGRANNPIYLCPYGGCE